MKTATGKPAKRSVLAFLREPRTSLEQGGAAAQPGEAVETELPIIAPPAEGQSRWRSSNVADRGPRHSLRTLALSLTLAMPVVLQAQFSYVVADGALTITYYTGPGGDVIIPSTINGLPVTHIGSEAFGQRANLTSVFVPDSVLRIGYGAFRSCTGLTSVTMGNGVTSLGEEAFYRCASLTTVDIPNSVTEIGPEAFWFCTSLTTVTIGTGLTNTGAAFLNCPKLGTLTVHPLNPSFSSVDGVLFNKNQTTLLQYPTSRAGNYAIPDNLTTIGAYAFAFCSNLTGVTIPATVLSIGGSAFLSCTSLGTLVLPNSVTSLGSSACSNCTHLTNMTLPNSITIIGNGAFSGCTRLTSVTIPDAVTSIASSAFRGCVGLTTAVIGSGVKSIADSAFSDCTSLTSVNLPNGVTTLGIGAFTACTNLATLSLPQSLTRIGDYAFRNCTSLTSVSIPANVTVIWSQTFFGCTSLTSVDLPETLTTINSEAFSGCTSLTSVIVPKSVTFIGMHVFHACTSLRTITVDAVNASYSSLAGVLFDKVQTVLMQFPSGKTGSYTIPGSVTAILDSAFERSSNLTTVTIPSSVASIGLFAFTGCTSLTAITVADMNASYSSADGVLFDKNKTTIVQYPAGRSGSYTIPITVTGLGPTDAFHGCANLHAIMVEASHTSLSSVDGVLFDESQSILMRCPPGRTGGYVIPSHVTTIRGYAFSSCTGLTTVTMPASVATIGYQAFSFCPNLRSVYCEGNAPHPSSGGFLDDPSATVYFLPGTTGWGPTFGETPAVPAVMWNPQAEFPGVVTGQFGFSVTGPADADVVVEAAEDLSASAWLPLVTLRLGAAGSSSFQDPEWSTFPSRFYRFRWP